MQMTDAFCETYATAKIKIMWAHTNVSFVKPTKNKDSSKPHVQIDLTLCFTHDNENVFAWDRPYDC